MNRCTQPNNYMEAGKHTTPHNTSVAEKASLRLCTISGSGMSEQIKYLFIVSPTFSLKYTTVCSLPSKSIMKSIGTYLYFCAEQTHLKKKSK